jgi:hypothetical protein
MMQKLSAEEWLAELEATIKAYRAADKVGPVSTASARSDATARTRKLGLTDGDASRYLDGKKGLRP